MTPDNTWQGVLLREMMRDPLLSVYSVVILDEAHQRTVFFDILVGLLFKACVHCLQLCIVTSPQIMRKRPELRVIISSATMDAEEFREYFNTNKTADASQDTASIMTIQAIR